MHLGKELPSRVSVQALPQHDHTRAMSTIQGLQCTHKARGIISTSRMLRKRSTTAFQADRVLRRATAMATCRAMGQGKGQASSHTIKNPCPRPFHSSQPTVQGQQCRGQPMQ